LFWRLKRPKLTAGQKAAHPAQWEPTINSWEGKMRVGAIASFALGLLLGVAAAPAIACELHNTEAAATTSVVALLSGQPVNRSLAGVEPAACKADGAVCTDDSECCSGQCKQGAEGRACMPK
jgi:hypothetical protein